MLRRSLAMIGIFSFFFGGCSKPVAPAPQAAAKIQPSSALVAPPEVTAEEEEGFHDLLFYIQEHERQPDGSQHIRCQGTHKGRQLGLEVILAGTWQGGSLDAKIPMVTYRGSVTYRSTGPDSDALVQALDELYETKVGAQAMAQETRFNALSLEGNPGDLAKGPVKIKLFFESADENLYAELFTNIDLSARRLEVREKDEGYRLPVVKALQAR